MGERVRLRVVDGDITALDVDAIVNPARADLTPGAGVCGAIHAAAGPELASAAMDLAPCPTGRAVITPGFRLAARHVIHAVGPMWDDGEDGEDAQLASAYRESLALAAAAGCRTVAFPPISTGAYGFPPERAAGVAVRAVRAALEDATLAAAFDEILFCCFGERSARLHARALEAAEPWPETR